MGAKEGKLTAKIRHLSNQGLEDDDGDKEDAEESAERLKDWPNCPPVVLGRGATIIP